MKKLTIIIFILASMSIFAQNTYVPDDNFEQALIDLGHDSGELNDSVPTANINGLTSLDVNNKSISDLTGIEDFAALTDLICYSNQLTSLDLTQNIALSGLGCSSNQLTNLDMSQNTSLIILFCYSNQLTSLDVRNGNNTNITDFFTDDNPNLTCIFVDDAVWSETNWTNIDPASTFVETQAECDALFTYIPDDNFEQALIDLGYDSGPLDNYVLTANISVVTELDIHYKNISNLTGIEDFISLTDFDCTGIQITNLDVSKNISLTKLCCSGNLLTNIDLTQNTALTEFWCFANELTNIDISQNTALTELYCFKNSLTSINTNQNTNLEIFICSENQLLNLDLTHNTALLYLSCNKNQLTSINMSQNNNISLLDCDSNQLTDLDIQNGNNENIAFFKTTNNPNLTCIFVDDASWSETNWTNIDPASTFVETQAECDALGVNDIIKDAGFAIYPNPAKDKFSIQTSNEIENLKIYDIFGKLLEVYGKQETYSVSDLASGVYLIHARSNKDIQVSKLVVE